MRSPSGLVSRPRCLRSCVFFRLGVAKLAVKCARGRTVTLKMKFNDFEIITRSSTAGRSRPDEPRRARATVPPIRKIETDEFGMPTDKVLRESLSVKSFRLVGVGRSDDEDDRSCKWWSKPSRFVLPL